MSCTSLSRAMHNRAQPPNAPWSAPHNYASVAYFVRCLATARHSLLATLFLVFYAILAIGAAHAACRNDIAEVKLIGQGEFCIMGFCLYHAQLLAQRPQEGFTAPFALSLTYKRNIKGSRLVDAGIDEIRRQASTPVPVETLNAWRADMTRAFPDVAPGDEICGVFIPHKGVRFYSNGTLRSEIDDPGFAEAFFNIWLAPNTRASSLRRALLGEPS